MKFSKAEQKIIKVIDLISIIIVSFVLLSSKFILKFAKNVVFINETLYIYRFKADNKLSNYYSLQVIKDLCYKFNYYKQCFQTYDFYNQTTCSWYFNRINSYIID